MKLLHNLTFKRKLTVLTLVTTTLALLLAGVVLVVYEIRTFREGIVNDVSAQAKILANLSTAALSFKDPAAATEMLNELRQEPYIMAAVLFDTKGSVFAMYQRDPAHPAWFPPEAPTGEGHDFTASHLNLHRAVRLNGLPTGTVFIVSDMQQLHSRLRQYVVIVLGVLAASSLFALWLSSSLQRVISAPILQLCATARRIAEEKDFALRAEKLGGDEIGVFTDAFSKMLAQIQSQDAALKRSGQQLDALVHSIDGIVWECTSDTFQFTFVSRQSERLLGYKPEEWLANPQFWQQKLHPEDAAKAIATCREMVVRRQPYNYEYRMLTADQRTVWIRESGMVLVEQDQPMAVRGIFQDITEQKLAAEELAKLNHQLVDTSRQAGMAEVATGVIHNVGNVLNSVNVSCTLAIDCVRRSAMVKLSAVAALLQEHEQQLPTFLTEDSKGKLIPGYLGSLVPVLIAEQSTVLKELCSLRDKIDHIKEIVSMQQSYATTSGVIESLTIPQLVEDAIRLNTGALARHSIQVQRQFEAVPPVATDKHKVLQILLNLIRNAQHACNEDGREPKIMILRVFKPAPERVQVQVIDNGVGIPPENLTKIFSHGFTTRKGGHGFGLHSGANAAHELGGSLTAQSEGLGRGATFTLELPLHNPPCMGQKLLLGK